MNIIWKISKYSKYTVWAILKQLEITLQNFCQLIEKELMKSQKSQNKKRIGFTFLILLNVILQSIQKHEK